MAIDKQSPPSWWGDFKLDNEQSRLWHIGPLTLIVRCLSGEWQIAHERMDDWADSEAVPNESLIKSEVTTLTRFPIRRLDMMVGVAYKEDLKKVRAVLDEVADRNPLCLEEPKPRYIFQGFGESSLDIQFSVWSKRESFLDLRNSIYQEIKSAFDEHGIEIPFPHRTIYTGSATTPFPIQSV